jgi:hypothetical protein
VISIATADAVEPLSFAVGAAWFDKDGLAVRWWAAGSIEVELTPGALSDPFISDLVRRGGHDPAAIQRAMLAAIEPPQPRRRGRPEGGGYSRGTARPYYDPVAVYFEVSRLLSKGATSAEAIRTISNLHGIGESRLREMYYFAKRSLERRLEPKASK